MSTSHSITKLIDGMKSGNPLAAQEVWNRYVNSLIRVANRRLRTANLKLGDSEDAVVMAFAQFLNRLNVGGFSKLDDRTDLWKLLVMLTERRALDMIRRERTAKSGAGLTVGEGQLEAGEDSGPALDRFASPEPTAEFVMVLLEEFRERLEVLQQDDLKDIARFKMNGYNNQEVADHMEISLRSVERKLKLIREIWQQHLPDDERL